MFDRLIGLIGNDNLNKLNNSRVLIVGIGGVGGFALECLIRSGIGHITVVDGDTYEITNLNRQIGSKIDNIGKYKVDEAIKRAKEINPNIDIKGCNKFVDESNINEVNDFDYIIDACDDINAKILLIKKAIDNNIKIISSCGTGKRLDPSQVEITKLSKTYNDPLAKALRSRLKKEDINNDIPVVFSKELPLNNKQVISSCIIVPSTAGIYMASYIVNDIIKK